MLKQEANLVRRITIALDMMALSGAFVLAYLARQRQGGLDDITDYLWLLLIILPVWYFVLSRFKIYTSQRLQSLAFITTTLIKVQVVAIIICASLIFLLEPRGISRLFIGYFVLISLCLLLITKVGGRLALHLFRKMGYNFRNIIVVGCSDKALDFISLIERHQHWGLNFMGVVHAAEELPEENFTKYPLLGRLEDLIEICKEHPVDEVVFCLSKEYLTQLDEYVRELEILGVTVRMVLDLFDLETSKTELSYFHDEIPMLTFHSKVLDANQLFLKRGMDIAGGMVGLAFTMLVLPFIAIAIKLDSPGPLIFGQKRVRENGRLFTCWKFRSMYQDADERKHELLQHNEMSGAMFKMQNDPRITRVGNFLRKTSLDELPQFWNVLRGEMSLVGTRPPTPDEVDSYDNWHRRRISIKPGITGLWQVSGRNKIQDFDEVVRLDLLYIDTWSLWFDFKIIAKTVLVVFKHQGSF
jgi:exopolysaccharide biosynthesis polyprenyl glycosylphosphotransferase